MKVSITVSLFLVIILGLAGCNISISEPPIVTVESSLSLPSSAVSQVSQESSLPPSSETLSVPANEEDPEEEPPHPAVPTGAKLAPDQDTWYLHLVNFDHPLPDDYAPPSLTEVALGYNYDSRAAQPLWDMLAAAAADGVSVYVTSAFRAIETQQYLYEQEIQMFRNSGYGEEEAIAAGGSLVAYPGTSEHQLGLAVDFLTAGQYDLTEAFENTEAFAWLSQHAADYGFVLRFPKDKQHITRISYEPWHYRYVTPEHAQEMNRLGLCLEEYVEFLETK